MKATAPSIPLATVDALDAAWSYYRDLRLLEHGDKVLVDCPTHQSRTAAAFRAYMAIYDAWVAG